VLLLRVIFLISSVLVLDISSVYNFHNPFVLFLSVPSKGHFFFLSVLLLDIPSVVTFTKDVEIEMELDDSPAPSTQPLEEGGRPAYVGFSFGQQGPSQSQPHLDGSKAGTTTVGKSKSGSRKAGGSSRRRSAASSKRGSMGSAGRLRKQSSPRKNGPTGEHIFDSLDFSHWKFPAGWTFSTDTFRLT
jgi:hypothetical protein